MHNQIVKPDPADFGLNSFLQLYGKRDPIPGEMGLSFDTFRRSLLAHYAPKTGYEATLVDNLVDIQWQINQHCEMRNTLLRDEINTAIIKAVVDQEYNVWDDQIDTERDAWIEAGNDEDDFEYDDFDHQGAKKRGKSLARGLVQTDANARARAEEEMEELGLSSQSLKAEIYRQNSGSIDSHNETIEKLEDRRRRVQADIEALQAARPVDQAPVIEG